MNIENPSFNYDIHGKKYSTYRQTDERIAQYIIDALGSSQTVLNVGAGGGSYEPNDRYVVAVEPSSSMRMQRLKANKVPAVIGTADSLPFDEYSFDASMATLTIHHWPDLEKGLKELRRVTKDQIVIMTYDPEALDVFWNAYYFPELIEVEKARYPKIDDIVGKLGGESDIIEIPIPIDCQDGFQEAFYARPEAFLEKEIRQSQSAWGFLSEGVEHKLVKRLKDDLDSGIWDEKFGSHRNMPFFNGALRLIISTKN
ncbi:methyltransferase domain-containing protein [Gracilibacillus salitolerans]|uniref:Methyltransferase domain-containing protein n=1 Tax=Gracilibacillus salitolerans TaxID=2663022 RepID=A0A5Q2TIU9_9BACI|nr:class I SAM-dependent methyltransferase [Gracilibacillus salitolerans]QGH33318.1 methyltransferase domain-containing protein [Gracilibacillus salitolerans]